jgi:hypothetical protein
MVNYKIKTHIDQVKFFNYIVKLLPLQNFECIAVDEQCFVTFDFSVA